MRVSIAAGRRDEPDTRQRRDAVIVANFAHGLGCANFMGRCARSTKSGDLGYHNLVKLTDLICDDAKVDGRCGLPCGKSYRAGLRQPPDHIIRVRLAQPVSATQ